MTDTSRRLRNALTARGMSVLDLSDRTGIPAYRLNRIVNGDEEPRQGERVNIEHELGITL